MVGARTALKTISYQFLFVMPRKADFPSRPLNDEPEFRTFPYLSSRTMPMPFF